MGPRPAPSPAAPVPAPSAAGGAARPHLMENHDEAYRVWREAGLSDRILLHIDAHHDMYWAEEGQPPTIANYICPALREGLLREVHWVVPDPSWDQPGGPRILLRHVKDLLRRYPTATPSPRLEPHRIAATALGRPLYVYPLKHLARIAEPLLLDIDTDFFLIPHIAFGALDRHSPLPWCWPEALVDRLRDCGVTARCATVAYSVEGGFTPLRWKHLGAEVAARLGAEPDPAALEGFAALRRGAEAAARGETQAAESAYRLARRLLPDHAAPAYHLAQLYCDGGRLDEARALYRDALALDPTYRTPYNSQGLWHQEAEQLDRAEAEHRRTLRLDPEDPWAHYGLGLVAERREQWTEAEARLSQALALAPTFTDAHRALGRVLAGLGRIEEAVAAYERSLKLALAGHKPLHEPIATLAGPGTVIDPDHGRTHALLARLYERRGRGREAVAGYRIAFASGYDAPWARARLARCYLRQRRWTAAAAELWGAARLLPLRWGHAVRRALTRARIA